MNSRLRISNHLELAKQAKILKDRAARLGNRALLVVINSPDNWLEGFARTCQSQFFNTASAQDRADRISALLGTERSMAVIQLGHKPDLGLLAAAAGTVIAGGICIVGMHAGYSAEAEVHGLTQDESSGSNYSNHRLERLATQAEQSHSETVLCVEVVSDTRSTAMIHITDINAALIKSLSCCDATSPDSTAKAEQDSLLVEARTHIETNTTSCVVIKGRRGRGKSSLLARLAMHLDTAGANFRVTALHESALRTFRKHADLPEDRYLSSELAVTKASTDILLVDEAASISIKQLQHYLNRYRHVVLCTTIEGYETSGRAFDVRLVSDWSHQSMALKQLVVNKSWRWRENDALEQFTDNLLLNKAANLPNHIAACPVSMASKLAGDCQPMQVSQQDLVNDESLLASIHSLLNSTHYQTTTKDLEHLLDAPTVQIWVQSLSDRIVGVLVLEQEGNIKDNLHEAIRYKQRRLPNQLLPQLLCQTADSCAALEKTYIRIVRLAVTSSLRRQGLASSLLDAITTWYSTPGAKPATVSEGPACDAIGASFAADTSSIAFWKSQGYAEFHRGFRSNPRTGKQAVAVMRSLEPDTAKVLSIAVDIHRDNELARRMNAADLPLSSKDQKISQRDVNLLERFAAGQRSKHDTHASLQRLSTLIHLPLRQEADQQVKLHELELRKCVKKWIESGEPGYAPTSKLVRQVTRQR